MAWVRWVLALAVCLASCGCGKPGGEAVDAAEGGSPGGSGDSIRIVAHSPAVGVALREMGLDRFVVARHRHDVVLERALPVSGDLAGMDYETVLRAGPTHVLTESGRAGPPTALVEMAVEHGWVLRDYRTLGIDDVRAMVEDLERIFGGEMDDSGRAAVAAFRAGVVERRDARRWDGRVLLRYGATPPAALGPGSVHHELLARCGGVSAFAEGGAFIEMHAEDVARLAPDGIVLIEPRSMGEAPGARSGPEVLARLGSIGRLEIPAVRTGRVARIDDPLADIPSMSLSGFAEELAAILDGWAASGG